MSVKRFTIGIVLSFAAVFVLYNNESIPESKIEHSTEKPEVPSNQNTSAPNKARAMSIRLMDSSVSAEKALEFVNRASKFDSESAQKRLMELEVSEDDIQKVWEENRKTFGTRTSKR